MSSSISNFKTTLSKNLGLARANRFKVTFSSVPGWSESIEDLSVMCDSVSMPSRQILTTDYSLHRHTIKVPVGYTESDIIITFNVTQNYLAKKALDSWLSKVVDVPTYRVNYNDVYRKDIAIQQLDTSDAVIYTATVKDAFPYEISALEFSNDSQEIVKVQATFAYGFFELS
jgi:hypothetical protein